MQSLYITNRAIDVGERDWKRKWASENIRASLSCLLFLPQMRKTHYASRRSRTRDTVKLTVCVCVCVCVCLSVCVSVPAVTAQRLQCDES